MVFYWIIAGFGLGFATATVLLILRMQEKPEKQDPNDNSYLKWF